MKNFVDIANFLLDHGAYIDADADDYMTPLHWACMANKREVALALVERGANTNKKTKVCFSYYPN